MERKKTINLIIYLGLIISVIVFIYKNNNLSKQLVQQRNKLKSSTNKIITAQKEYKKLEKEYTQIKDDLKIIKQDFLILKSVIKSSNRKNITQVKDITTKLSDIILEQENYTLPDFDSIHTIGPIFKTN